MIKLQKLNTTVKNYLPLFILLCLSGNPIITSEGYSKNLLVIYTFLFSIYSYYLINWEMPIKVVNNLGFLILLILTLAVFQNYILGFVSFPGVFALILRIILGVFTLLYYQYKKIDFIDAYIKILAFLSILSIPFFILNQFGYFGIQLELTFLKSLILYTSIEPYGDITIARNSGMFWEPGAFAGYLLLAILFIALKNGKFIIGSYKKEMTWIIIGLITTQSTTGYLAFLCIIFIHAMQNYSWGRIIVVPLILLISFFAYNELDFLNEKIEHQFTNSSEMNEGDISNSRFGSLNMDMQYIKAQPLIGNGLHIKTRYRYHPEVTEDIGNGNGMSNFSACWGIPFFLLWLYYAYKFALLTSQSITTSIAFVSIIILLLQGEQFLNYPLFLSFFTISSIIKINYENSLVFHKF